MKVTLVVLAFLILSVTAILNSPSFGSRPDQQAKVSFEKSKQFNKEFGIFENRRQSIIKEMKERNMSFKLITEWFRDGDDRIPSAPLPEVRPNLKEFLSSSKDLKIIWFGHSTFMLNMDGVIILVDPIFGKSAAPFDLLVNRFQPPVLSLEELPKIDYILISHDHYDHLDMTSTKFFSKKDIKFITPLGVGSHLKGWGIKEENITERDWWESVNFSGVEFIATPSQHFSGRSLTNNNETLWASWVLKSKEHSVYFSGDSGYDTHFKEIGEKYGPFDIAFLESGQYSKNWREVHMLPEEAALAYNELRAKRYFPVHWGMFKLSFHAWRDPIERLLTLSLKHDINLIVPMIGEIVNLSDEKDLERWWESIP